MGSAPQTAQMSAGSGPLFGKNTSSNYAVEQMIAELLRKKMGGGDMTQGMSVLAKWVAIHRAAKR